MVVPQDSMWAMKPNVPLALQLAKRDVPALVYDAVNLEGVAMFEPFRGLEPRPFVKGRHVG